MSAPVIVVAGLARDGTSLMSAMLVGIGVALAVGVMLVLGGVR